MQPQPFAERHVLFRPKNLPSSTGPARGGTQGVAAAQKAAGKQQEPSNQDLFYLELVRGMGEDGKSLDERSEDGKRDGGWRMVVKETPAPGKMRTIVRTVTETEVVSGDAQAYVEALGYVWVTLYSLTFVGLLFTSSE
jgi:hypothetical protein